MTEIALAVARSEPAGVGLDSMGRPCVRSIKSLWWGIEPHVSASAPHAAVRHALGETEGMDEYVNRLVVCCGLGQRDRRLEPGVSRWHGRGGAG
jgi:hypothetical protein